VRDDEVQSFHAITTRRRYLSIFHNFYILCHSTFALKLPVPHIAQILGSCNIS
jgi:hypothetical protein